MTNTASSAEDDDVVITPRGHNTRHNFGPASPRDEVLYTSERPGGDPQGDGAKITIAQVQDWIDFMKERHRVRHVIVLLDDNELKIYEPPGLLETYEANGLVVHRNPMEVDGAAANVMRIIREVEGSKERAVVHCTHGMGRSGRVAAGWLAVRYGLSPEEATREALETARRHGMERMGNRKVLEEWLRN